MSKIRRKVTVENTKTISDSTSRRPSVFERLGPSTGSTAEVSGKTIIYSYCSFSSSWTDMTEGMQLCPLGAERVKNLIGFKEV